MNRFEADIVVPDFTGMQALDAWNMGHDLGLLLQGPDPDAPEPLMHGIVTAQEPPAGTRVVKWAEVTVWVHNPGDEGGVRVPRHPIPPLGTLTVDHPEER